MYQGVMFSMPLPGLIHIPEPQSKSRLAGKGPLMLCCDLSMKSPLMIAVFVVVFGFFKEKIGCTPITICPTTQQHMVTVSSRFGVWSFFRPSSISTVTRHCCVFLVASSHAIRKEKWMDLKFLSMYLG